MGFKLDSDKPAKLIMAGEPRIKSGITVFLDDRGQDFLEFDIKDGHIVSTRPFQWFVWDGAEVFNKTLTAGDQLRIRTKHRGDIRTINYPITEIRALRES